MSLRRAAPALLALALLGSGCAALKSPVPPRQPTAAAPAGVSADAGAHANVQVQVIAPAPLKVLLERHLDLVRLPTLARGEAIGDFELTRLIDATPAQARELLQTEAYFNAEVTAERVSSSGSETVVRVVVQPGAPTRVARVDIEAEGDLERAAQAGDSRARGLLAELRQGWLLPVDSLFRNVEWSDAKSATLARLRAAGYASATWSGTAADIDAQNQRARLFLVADSGPLYLSGTLEIEGLKLHDRSTVQNLAHFGPGTPVTDTLLLDFQDRLQKSGLFERVSVTLDAAPDQAGAAPVRVRLVELSRHQLVTGVGVSANSGPRVTLEHIDRRFFDRAASARNKLEWGRSRQAWNGELSTHTRPDLYRNLIGMTIERLKTDTDVVLSQRLRVGRAQDSQRLERFYFGEYLRDVRRTDLTRVESNAATLNSQWVWRDIDNPLLPTDGQTLSLQAALGRAGGTAEGRGTFGRVYGRLTGYWPLGRQWYGQARIELGQILGSGRTAVPETLGFRAGGDDSVRGYAYRTLGPVTDGAVGSGLVLMTGSVELARPILPSMPSLWGALFVDAGNAADRWSDLKPVFGAGAGLRWRSPVGPLKLDLAYGSEVRRTRLHFSVGIVF